MGGGMLAEIVRQIAETDFRLAVPRMFREGRGGQGGRLTPGGGELLLRRAVDREKREQGKSRAPFARLPQQRPTAGGQPVPRADALLAMDQETVGFGIIRFDPHRFLIGEQRLVEPVQLVESGAAIAVRLGVVRGHAQRGVVASQRLFEPAQLMEDGAAVIERAGIIRREAERGLAGRHRFVEAP